MTQGRRVLNLDSMETFVLVGRDPADIYETERVLIQSKNAPIELLGYVRSVELETNDDDESDRHIRQSRRTSRLLDRVLGTEEPVYSVIRSRAIPPRRVSSDIRATRYSFAWQGRIPYDYALQIEKALSANLPDILRHIEDDDGEAARWSFASIASILADGRRRKSASSRQTRTIFLLYLALVAVATIVALVVTTIRLGY